jgi:branched-chain amino acid transport system substrate-binding protein
MQPLYTLRKRAFLLVILTCFSGNHLFAYEANLKIGVVRPKSGIAANLGEQLFSGIRTALYLHQSEENKLKNLVSLVEIDDQGKLSQADVATKNLLGKYRTHVVIGSISDTLNQSIAQAASEKGKISILPMATSDKWLSKHKYAYSTSLSEIGQARQTVKFISKNLSKSSVVVLHENSHPSASTFTETFTAVAKKVGLKMAQTVVFDLSPQSKAEALRQIEQLKPSIIVLPGHYSAVTDIIEKIDLKLKVTFVASQGFDHPEIETKLKPLNNPLYFLSLYHKKCLAESCIQFLNAYKTLYPRREPDVLSFLGYSAMDTVVSTFIAANSNRTTALERQLQNTKQIQSLLGPFRVSSSGVIVRQSQIFKLLKGNISYFGTSDGPYSPKKP